MGMMQDLYNALLGGPGVATRMGEESQAFRQKAREEGLGAALRDPKLQQMGEALAGDMAFEGTLGGGRAMRAGFPEVRVWEGGPRRYDIPDDKFQFKDGGYARLGDYDMDKGQGIALEKIVEHPELFKVYPELAETLVGITDRPVMGYMSEHGLALNPERIERRGSLPGTMLHEMQHKVQDLEGHVNGANVGYFINKDVEGIDAGLQRWLSENQDSNGWGARSSVSPVDFEIARQLQKGISDVRQDALARYLGQTGEVEARATADRLSRGGTGPYKIDVDPELIGDYVSHGPISTSHIQQLYNRLVRGY